MTLSELKPTGNVLKSQDAPKKQDSGRARARQLSERGGLERLFYAL